MRLEISVRLKTARRILPKVTLRASLLKAKYSLVMHKLRKLQLQHHLLNQKKK